MKKEPSEQEQTAVRRALEELCRVGNRRTLREILSDLYAAAAHERVEAAESSEAGPSPETVVAAAKQLVQAYDVQLHDEDTNDPDPGDKFWALFHSFCKLVRTHG